MAQDPRALIQKVSPLHPHYRVEAVSSPRALTHELQADKALSGAGGGLGFFGGRTEKYESAADLYTQAANAFRVQKQGDSPQ
jgi:hypothetical protein